MGGPSDDEYDDHEPAFLTEEDMNQARVVDVEGGVYACAGNLDDGR